MVDFPFCKNSTSFVVSYLIQLADNIETADEESIQSNRFLRMFCVYRSVCDENDKVIAHYVLVIGYIGGNCQEDCFYKITEPSNEVGEVWIAIPSGDGFYQKHFANAKMSDCEQELTSMDIRVQNELISEMNQFLIYDDLSDFFYYNTACIAMSSSNFVRSDEFPSALLSRLCKTFWPFSVSW
jgi:hypothetical protein